MNDQSAWQYAWRVGIAPQLSTPELQALLRALQDDAPELVQGMATDPPPLKLTQNKPIEAGCAVCLAAWWGSDLETSGEIEKRYREVIERADVLCQPVGRANHFLDWFDSTPRQTMRVALMREVECVLNQRYFHKNEVAMDAALN